MSKKRSTKPGPKTTPRPKHGGEIPSGVILSHASGAVIEVEAFVAGWIVWVHQFHEPADWRTFSLPRGNQKTVLADSLKKGQAGSLDVLCRMLAPETYRNVMQATNPWLEANRKWVSESEAVSPFGKRVNGGALTREAIAAFDGAAPVTRLRLIQKAVFLAHQVF